MNFFTEIARTNKAYCASLGLPDDTYDRPLSVAEVYGKPLSPDETRIARIMQNGTSRRAAELFVALNQMPAAPVRVRPSSIPHCIVETVRRPPTANEVEARAEQDARVNESIQDYYAECRASGSPCFVGD